MGVEVLDLAHVYSAATALASKNRLPGRGSPRFLAQRLALEFFAIQAAALQLRHELVAELVERARKIGELDGEAVGSLGREPFFHLVGDRLDRSDHGKAAKAAQPLRELAHRQVFALAESDGALAAAHRGIALGDVIGQRLSGSNFEASWPSAIDSDAIALA